MKKTTDEQQREEFATIKKRLVGRTITSVLYLPEEDADEMDWFYRPIVLKLDDGSHLFPMCDCEGNDGGALATSYDDLPVISSLW